MKLDLVILAAGFSRRFKTNKLLYQFKDKCLIAHTFDKIDKQLFDRILVVTQYAEIANLAKEHGFMVAYNFEPQKGISSSLQVAIKTLKDSEQMMFLVADMPYLEAQSLLKLAQLADGEHIICAYDEQIQNPMIFPSCYYGEIMALEHDQGAKKVALKHPDKIIRCVMTTKELKDIDIQEDVA
ncbi:MAG: nucleotidyltransferase family protein [Erysipelotrichaceae bacterium]|nr:nucleotidyltransferase family protein [Erysipelotrichaceae bacterium]MDY5251651.1 nucleotidyltransferase family protein [Erysipelotrichaceae bacterium]